MQLPQERLENYVSAPEQHLTPRPLLVYRYRCDSILIFHASGIPPTFNDFSRVACHDRGKITRESQFGLVGRLPLG